MPPKEMEMWIRRFKRICEMTTLRDKYYESLALLEMTKAYLKHCKPGEIPLHNTLINMMRDFAHTVRCNYLVECRERRQGFTTQVFNFTELVCE